MNPFKKPSINPRSSTTRLPFASCQTMVATAFCCGQGAAVHSAIRGEPIVLAPVTGKLRDQ